MYLETEANAYNELECPEGKPRAQLNTDGRRLGFG
jgi:hypothetical protein